jgi:hypothetical protein
MVLPVQSAPGVGAGTALELDAEIAFWAEDAADASRWTFAAELRALAAREPALDLRTSGLSTTVLLDESREHIGDPLLGDLRRLGAVADRPLALVPVRLTALPEGAGALALDLALVNTVGGAVLWRGRLVGGGGQAPAVADLARVFVRSFLPE